MKYKMLLAFATVSCFFPSAFAQQPDQMPFFAPQIKRVAVFKNGYAFTYREGEAQINNGWAYTTNMPIGVMGTVWGYTTAPSSRVVQMIAAAVPSESPTETLLQTTDLADFLRLNEGARVRMEGYGNKVFEGTYKVLGKNDYLTSIALQTETGTMILKSDRIDIIEIIGQAKWEKKVITPPVTENRLQLKVEGAKENQKLTLGIAALERGIRWIPAYRVEVKGDPVKEAKLELEATLINELADLNNTEVYFVVGVPSFLFQETVSPLSLNQTFAGVSSFFQPIGTGREGSFGRNAASNAIMTQQTAYNGSETSGGSLTSNILSPEEQAMTLSADQLFLYKTDQIALKKDARASLRLFSLTVPCSEVFEWTIGDPPQTENAYLEINQQPRLESLTNRIWYALRLKNQTGMPWTTAPALSFRDWKPMGQDMLSFTPIGGENILHITPATEVIGTQKLEEKERVSQQLQQGNSTYTFDLVTIEGRIKIRNAKKQPIELILTRNVIGEAVAASDDGTIRREGFNLQAINPNSVVKWNLTIPPGEKEISYTYKVYVRR